VSHAQGGGWHAGAIFSDHRRCRPERRHYPLPRQDRDLSTPAEEVRIIVFGFIYFSEICRLISHGACLLVVRVSCSEMLLLDSGGQYEDGTTDVTRTMLFGSPSTEQREMFTRVLKGHIGEQSKLKHRRGEERRLENRREE
jgi:hypothetical protein